MYIIVIILISCTFRPIDTIKNIDEYNVKRAKLLEDELQLSVGGNMQLNHEEMTANAIVMRVKKTEHKRIDFSKHYFKYKDDINNTKMYQIIRMMPKGAALHVHSSFMINPERLFAITYEEHLYICLEDDIQLKFSVGTPPQYCPEKWHLISELRNSSKSAYEFDMTLKRHFTLYTENERDFDKDINYVWNKFKNVGRTIYSLTSYRPVRERLFYEALEEFYNDNIMYVEIRSGLSFLYELNGTVHDISFLPHLYRQVASRFQKDHLDFLGVKLILTQGRFAVDKLNETLETAQRLKRVLPNFFAGFDLVGQEDLGKPLSELRPVLEEVKRDMNFYFHGGETNWFGTSSDENLFDAVLLGSKRIGHGYALIKHPSLMATVKEKDIAIEVNVISNVVLSLLRDVRNHPLATYLALDMPVVLSSDDPGAWGADPISHDFYVAFAGVASKRADLRMLKQLVINSIKYSSLDEKDRSGMMAQFHVKWNKFIQKIIVNYK